MPQPKEIKKLKRMSEFKQMLEDMVCKNCQHFVATPWNKAIGKCKQSHAETMTKATATCNWWGLK